MNVPDRPKVVTPVGPKLEVQTPAKLSGPKVVRVEAPDVVDLPKPRRVGNEPPIPVNRAPRSGVGAGTGPAVSAEEEARNRRNKRRTGPGEAAAAPGNRTAGSRRSGRADAEITQWSEQDLIERESRLSRSEGFLRQRRRDQKIKDQGHRGHAAPLAQTGGRVAIAAPFTIKDLSAATGVKAAEIVKKLFLKGIMATANSGIDVEQAQEIMRAVSLAAGACPGRQPAVRPRAPASE